MKWNLVYFDDQIENIECLSMILEEYFNLIGCQDPLKWSELLESNYVHAFLIDVHMPVLDGLELHRKIVSHPAYNGCPVLFISGDLSFDNRLRSFQNGGVDFLTRDMSPDEMEGRLISKVRLFQKTASRLKVGNLTLDFEALKAQVEGVHIDLTLMEMRLLVLLVRNVPDALTKEEVLRKLWGGEGAKVGTISTHLSSMKQKLSAWDHSILTKLDQVFIKSKSVQ